MGIEYWYKDGFAVFNWSSLIQILRVFQRLMFDCWMKLRGVIMEMETPRYKTLLKNKIRKFYFQNPITLNNELSTFIQDMEFLHLFDKPSSPSVPFLSSVYHCGSVLTDLFKSIMLQFSPPNRKDTQVSTFSVNLWVSQCVGTCYVWYCVIEQTSWQFSVDENEGFRRDHTCR